MVGLSDIPCVGKIVDRISDATIDHLFRGFKYMFCYKDYVNTLNSEIEKLASQEERVSRKAKAEKDNGKTLYGDVPRWQTDVEEFQRSATEFSDKYKNRASWRCIHFLPIPEPVSRFRLGREAAQKVKTATELSNTGKDLLANEIAYLPPVENVPVTDTVFEDFESRKAVYMKLWEQLVTEGTSSILGIYGMPGVGKTRMMEQIWKEAKVKKIFDKVARADVGSDVLDVIKLQNQIAGHLGCHLESPDNLDLRASQLKKSLMNAGKVLVILDDVWREIPLDVIGIPSVDDSNCKGLKILLTSRKEDVCLRNNCKHPIKITTLKNDEAWALFRNTVGSMHDISMARKVCDKCAGLPLLIRGVGKALQFTSHNSWEDALDQLEKGTVEDITGIDSQVYTCVKLSIDRLPDDAKSCLFLCSLYPEDAYISIRKLIQIATGSQLVHGGKSRVCTMVNILSSSSLLLNGQVDLVIKLHDLIRDVARSMAVSDPKYAYSIVKCGPRFPDNPDYCTRKLLDLHLEENYFCFSDDLAFPALDKLWVHCNSHTLQLSGGFFNLFVNLRFLMIEGMSSSLELQFSLQSLGKLRTLILDKCDITRINQTNVGFFPKNLEVLCFWDCAVPIPLELPNLEYLRKLEFNRRNKRVQMLPNTISSLPNLEELHIPDGFEIQDDGSEPSPYAVSAPILTEISKLIGLKSLQMSFRNSEPFHSTNIFDNLREYDIAVSSSPRQLADSIISTRRSIYLDDTQLRGLESLMERAEEVRLVNTDIDVSSFCNSNRKAFSDLRDLYIHDCNAMEYVAMISQDEIENSFQPLTSFSKLAILYIGNCSTLKYLFSKSVAKGLVQLEVLSLRDCPLMEAIVMNGDTNDGDNINFSKLKSLNLYNRMLRLKSFSVEKQAIPRAQSQRPFFDGTVAFPSLEYLYTDKLDTISDIWGEHYTDNNASSFCKLKTLTIRGDKLETVIPPAMLNRMRNLEYIRLCECNNLRNVFPLCIARDLIHLKSMIVIDCGMMKEIIGKGEQKITDGIVFPELTSLSLIDLPNLASFWCYQTEEDNSYKVEFPSLVELDLGCKQISLGAKVLGIDDFTCQRLKELRVGYCGYSTALTLSVFRSLQQLQSLVIYDSEEIVEDVGGDEASDMDEKSITLLHLKSFTLRNLPNIRSFILNSNYECHMPALTSVRIDKCGLSTLFTFSALKSLPQLQELEITHCSLLEEIVEGARGDEASGRDKKTITLSQLRSVTLDNLPNLKNFISSANYECHMPGLTKVSINECGFSTLFTFSALRSLPQLQELRITDCSLLEEIVEGARGDEASGRDKKTITLSQLRSVTLRNLPNPKNFISSANYECHMPALTSVRIDKCGLSTLFTFSALKSLPQLQELVITDCSLLEEIVEGARGDEASGRDKKTITLSQLRSVYLYNLPNLKNFISSANYECHMPALTEVSIHNCGLSTLFTCPAFQKLHQLADLKVSNCGWLECIVDDVGDDETPFTGVKIITLSRLTNVHLRSLPNLRCFSSTSSYAFSMPKLIGFEMDSCPQMEYFTLLETKTSMAHVCTRWYQPLGEPIPDLNDYIRQIAKELETKVERVEEEQPEETIENDQLEQINAVSIGITEEETEGTSDLD